MDSRSRQAGNSARTRRFTASAAADAAAAPSPCPPAPSKMPYSAADGSTRSRSSSRWDRQLIPTFSSSAAGSIMRSGSSTETVLIASSDVAGTCLDTFFVPRWLASKQKVSCPVAERRLFAPCASPVRGPVRPSPSIPLRVRSARRRKPVADRRNRSRLTGACSSKRRTWGVFCYESIRSRSRVGSPAPDASAGGFEIAANEHAGVLWSVASPTAQASSMSKSCKASEMLPEQEESRPDHGVIRSWSLARSRAASPGPSATELHPGRCQRSRRGLGGPDLLHVRGRGNAHRHGHRECHGLCRVDPVPGVAAPHERPAAPGCRRRPAHRLAECAGDPAKPSDTRLGAAPGLDLELSGDRAARGLARLRWSNLRAGLPAVRRRWVAVAGLCVVIFVVAIAALTAIQASTSQRLTAFPASSGSGHAPSPARRRKSPRPRPPRPHRPPRPRRAPLPALARRRA